MPTTLQKIEAEALKLDLKSRTELVRRLEQSLKSEASSKNSSEIEAERLWIQEAMKRSREIRERAAGTSPPLVPSASARPVPLKTERASPRKSKPRPTRKPSPPRRKRR